MSDTPKNSVGAKADFVAETGPERLDLFLARATARSRSFLKEQIEVGGVTVNEIVVTKASFLLKAGDRVIATWAAPDPKPLKAVAYQLEILYEDEDMLVLNKPQGVITHPGAGFSGPTLVNYLMHHLQHHSAYADDFKETDRPGIVHRLDRGTSGVLCVAKNRPALEKLSAQFKDRKVTKIYEAMVWGKIAPTGKFRDSIGRDPKDRKKMSSRATHSRDALTEWKTLEQFAHFSHVRLFPKTGRTHQIRVHLSEGKHPIVADSTYGGKRQTKHLPLTDAVKTFLDKVEFTFLHAAELHLAQPSTGQALSFKAKAPAVFDEFLALLHNP